MAGKRSLFTVPQALLSVTVMQADTPSPGQVGAKVYASYRRVPVPVTVGNALADPHELVRPLRLSRAACNPVAVVKFGPDSGAVASSVDIIVTGAAPVWTSKLRTFGLGPPA